MSAKKGASRTPAPSLKKFLADATAKWPDRDRASDGIMGDTAHQARRSDHNDGNAVDITHDPDHGVDCDALVQQLLNPIDKRIKYLIWDRLIWQAATKKWNAYTGVNPHTKHLHVSIHSAARDDLDPWPWSPQATFPRLRMGDEGQPVRVLQEKLRARGYSVAIDGVFGLITQSNVKRFQQKAGLTSDGIVGPHTWRALDHAVRSSTK